MLRLFVLKAQGQPLKPKSRIHELINERTKHTIHEYKHIDYFH